MCLVLGVLSTACLTAGQIYSVYFMGGMGLIPPMHVGCYLPSCAIIKYFPSFPLSVSIFQVILCNYHTLFWCYFPVTVLWLCVYSNNFDMIHKWVFSTLQSCLTVWKPAGCPITHVNSDINYLVQVPQDCLQFRCKSQYWDCRVSILLSNLTIMSGIPILSSPPFEVEAFGGIFRKLYSFSKYSVKLGKTFSLLPPVKGHRNGQDEGVHWVSSWKEPKHRSFCPHGVGHCHPPCRVDAVQLLRISVPCYSGVFMEVLSCEYHWLNHWLLMIKLILQPLFPFWAWGVSLKVQPLVTWLVPLAPASILKLSRGPPRVSSPIENRHGWRAFHDWQETSFTCTTQIQGFQVVSETRDNVQMYVSYYVTASMRSLFCFFFYVGSCVCVCAVSALAFSKLTFPEL